MLTPFDEKKKRENSSFSLVLMFSFLNQIEPMMVIIQSDVCDRTLGEAETICCKLQRVSGKYLECFLLDGIIFFQVSLKIIGLGPEEKIDCNIMLTGGKEGESDGHVPDSISASVPFWGLTNMI